MSDQPPDVKVLINLCRDTELGAHLLTLTPGTVDAYVRAAVNEAVPTWEPDQVRVTGITVTNSTGSNDEGVPHDMYVNVTFPRSAPLTGDGTPEDQLSEAGRITTGILARDFFEQLGFDPLVVVLANFEPVVSTTEGTLARPAT